MLEEEQPRESIVKEPHKTENMNKKHFFTVFPNRGSMVIPTMWEVSKFKSKQIKQRKDIFHKDHN